jgi:flagellar hook-length control protein FliK
MPNPVPIQPAVVTPGQTVALIAPSGKAEPVVTFAALLSTLLQTAGKPEAAARSVADVSGPSGVPTGNTNGGAEKVQPAAGNDNLVFDGLPMPTIVPSDVTGLVINAPDARAPDIQVLDAKASDVKTSDTKPGTSGKTVRAHDRDIASEVQMPAGSPSGLIPAAALDLASQQAAAAAPPPKVVPPAESGTSASTATPSRRSGIQKNAELPRPGLAEPREKLPTQPDSSILAAQATAPSSGDQQRDKPTVKFDAVSEMVALTTRSEVPQSMSSGNVASPVSPAGQSPPALPAAHIAPADQIAPALVAASKAADGTPSVTVRLQPPELGQVHIRIDQPAGGAAHIDITAERPETLQLLQRDEPRLQQALDQAGVLSNGRTVSFQMSPPEQVGATASRPDSMETGSGGSGQGQSGGAWRQSEDSQRDFARGQNSDQGQARTRWFRAGLDITA